MALRGPRNLVDPTRPYSYLLEEERGPDGRIAATATLFLTNRECPFRCLMCDLWKNTTERTVPVGAIPGQIDWALRKLHIEPGQQAVRTIKLYNSGNFFDAAAIPRDDLPIIAQRLNDFGFSTVIVENHPRMCGDVVRDFAEQLAGQLEVAMGLETVHPRVLPRLNKQMTLDDFSGACERLRAWEIQIRAFILLKPPFLSATEAVKWAQQSATFAWRAGVNCCAVIPTRSGNGMLETLEAAGDFSEPDLSDLEQVMDWGVTSRVGAQRFFVDLWDAGRFSRCRACVDDRVARLNKMNLTQQASAPIRCGACGSGAVATRSSNPSHRS